MRIASGSPISEPSVDRHVWLVGAMGAGKSTVARLLAARLGVAAADTDDAVEREVGRPIAAFWADHGEEAFRIRETAAIAGLAAAGPTVIATGGGAVIRHDNVALMRSTGWVVWLTAEPATLAARAGNGTSRPLLSRENVPDPVAALAALLAARSAAYREAADVVVDTEGRAIDEVVDAAMRALEGLWDGS